MFNNLWVEKYRPKTLDEMVLSDDNRKYFSSLKDEVANLLLVGSPGIGKTTIARVIVNDILKCNYHYINASDENGIDTIRYKVSGFSQTKSIDGKVKVVILDEADGITIDGQRALRNIMEEYSSYTRFILTANYKHKIIPALQSRTQLFDLTPDISSVLRRVFSILTAENIEVNQDQRKQLAQIVKDNFPDFRKIINTVQKYTITGELVIPVKSTSKDTVSHVHTYLQKGEVLQLRKFLIENETDFQGDYHNLMKLYLNHIYNCDDVQSDTKKMIIIMISNHMYQDSFVIDKEINAFACFCQIEKLLKGSR